MRSARNMVLSLLDAGSFPGKTAIIYRWIVTLFVLIGTLVQILATVDGFPDAYGAVLWPAEKLALAMLTIDLLLHVAAAHLRRGSMKSLLAMLLYLRSPYGLIDLLAVVPFYVELILPVPPDVRVVFGVMRFLKLARYSPALETLAAVLKREGRPLQSALYIMGLLILAAATMLYMVERTQNSQLASIPQALWWAVVTVTTVGYGDVVPLSPLGKVLGGIVAVLGIGMFALPASILATGFSEEMRRRDFLNTWHMVAKVPAFHSLDAAQIAAITSLLKYIAAAPGDVLMRAGEVGDRMYFIVSGRVSIERGAARLQLKEGDFFGEIALLRNTRRTATVTALTRCQLLTLDARDFRRFLADSPQVGALLSMTAERRMNEPVEPS